MKFNLVKHQPELLFLAVILLFSCKSLKKPIIDPELSLPERFAPAIDSTANAAADLPWRDFFPEPALHTLIDSALSRNFDLKIALQRIRAARAGVRETEAALRPRVDGVAGVSIRKFGLYTMDGAGNITTEMKDGKLVPIHLPDQMIGLQSSWEIDLWGKLKALKKAALARSLAEEHTRQLLQTEIVGTLADAYYNLKALDAQTQMLNEFIAVQETMLAVVGAQKAAGASNALVIKQFEAQALNARAMLTDLEEAKIEQENLIRILCGTFPETPIARDSASLLRLPLLNTASGVPAGLLTRRPDIRRAAMELEAGTASLYAAKTLFYPGLNLNANIGTQAFRPDLLVLQPQSLAYGLLGGLSAPWINKRAIEANLQISDAIRQEALLAYHQTIVNAVNEVSLELSRMEILQRKASLKNAEMQALLEAERAAAELFRAGRADYLETLLVQQNAMHTRMEAIDVRRRQLSASVQLYRTLGGGWK